MTLVGISSRIQACSREVEMSVLVEFERLLAFVTFGVTIRYDTRHVTSHRQSHHDVGALRALFTHVALILPCTHRSMSLIRGEITQDYITCCIE